MFKFLIILLAIYLFFRLFAKLILNVTLRTIFNKANSNISRHQNQQTYSETKPEGHVSVHKVQKGQSQQGDFAEYEEVK